MSSIGDCEVSGLVKLSHNPLTDSCRFPVLRAKMSLWIQHRICCSHQHTLNYTGQPSDQDQMQLYRLSETQAFASSLTGVDDIERRQHVHQLTQKILAGCRQASQPFTWIRAAGLRGIAAALSAGLEDGQALASVLEAVYSQVLEAILSTLDRDLIPCDPAAAALAAACQQQCRSGSSSDCGGSSTGPDAAQLLAAVGRYPAGYAPAAASAEELQEAYNVLQALCLLHPKVRSLLSRAQHLQLITARACEAPGCLPAAMSTLLTLLQGNEEAQGLFVTTGGLDMLLTRTLQHLSQEEQQQQQCPQQEGAAGQSKGSGQPAAGGLSSKRELAVQLLLFLQLLEHWVVAEAVKAGAHPNTQRSALAQMVNQLGPDVAAVINQPLPSTTAAAAADASAGGGQAAAKGQGQATTMSEAAVSHEHVLQQRAEAAAAKLLRRLQGVARKSVTGQ